MADSINLILIFLAGGVTGALCAWLLIPARRQTTQLRQERDAAKAELQHHREEVDEHFLRTAELVNSMTQSYRQVHEHLSEGARKLCSDEGRRLARSKSLEPLPAAAPGLPTEAPLDYAPSHKGTLSEDFGLDKQADSTAFSPVDTGSEAASDGEDPVAPPRDYAEECDAQGCPPEPTVSKTGS